MNTGAIKLMLLLPVVWIASTLAPAGAQGVPSAATASTARAEPLAAPSLRDALEGVARGKYVRLEAGEAQRREGYFLGVRNDSLCIAQGEWELATAARDVRALWTRERAVRQGAIVGGITGGVAGGALIALIYAIATSLCDTGDCADYNAGKNVLAGLAGVVGGGLAGGLAGGVIGAAIPHWVVRYRAEDGSGEGSGAHTGAARDVGPGAPYLAEDRQGGYGLVMGSLSGAVDCARGAAPYTRFMLHVNVARHWTLVPEAGFTWKSLAQASTTICGTEGVSLCESSVSTPVLHAGLAARYSPYGSAVRPYLTAGAGGYAWNASFLGYSLGLGTMLAATSRHPIELELRYHANLQRLAEACPSRLISLTAGLQVATW